MNLVEELNKQYNNNFEYLKLLEIVYEKQSELCSIVFLYSGDKDEISLDDRNVISNFCAEKLNLNAKVMVKFRKSYQEVPEPDILALFGTHGFLEIALNHGKAASLLGIERDSSVDIYFED